MDVLLVIRQLGGEIDDLAGKHPAGRTSRNENQRSNEQHRADASKPLFQPRDERREEKGQQCRERQRNEEIARPIERGDNESAERDGPDADQRVGGGAALEFGYGRLNRGVIG